MIPPTPNPREFLFLLLLILFVPTDLFSQLNELVSEFQKTESEAESIADSIVGNPTKFIKNTRVAKNSKSYQELVDIRLQEW